MTDHVLSLPLSVKFEVTNPAHRKAYLDFLNNGKWTIRFQREYPFTSLPSMVMYKLAVFACSAEGEVDETLMLQSGTTKPGVPEEGLGPVRLAASNDSNGSDHRLGFKAG
jgi:hypothetical protein